MKFKIPPIDAPNVNGAQDLGFPVKMDANGVATSVRARDRRSNAAQCRRFMSFDPGPEGSIGDLAWIIEARRGGKLPLLIVQGVLLTPLAQAADIVLPGAAWVEKDAAYVNGAGRLQGASRAITVAGRSTGGLADLRQSRARTRGGDDLYEQRRRAR